MIARHKQLGVEFASHSVNRHEFLSMLNSYPAILKDGQLIWITGKPDSTKELRVVVVTEAPGTVHSQQEIARLLAETRGVIPRRAAADLNAGLEALRTEWEI
jgi:hypothetical protein